MHDSPVIRYGLGATAVGPALVALTRRGVCAVKIVKRREQAGALEEVRRLFPEAELVRDDRAARPTLRQLAAVIDGADIDVPLDLRGTPFQKQVWQALRRLPSGTTWSYSELARRVGRPRAVRAVASACARNPVAIFVPCHRIVRRDGGLGGYRWGLQCKQALLRREARDG